MSYLKWDSDRISRSVYDNKIINYHKVDYIITELGPKHKSVYLKYYNGVLADSDIQLYKLFIIIVAQARIDSCWIKIFLVKQNQQRIVWIF
jgi:hypothetical protein